MVAHIVIKQMQHLMLKFDKIYRVSWLPRIESRWNKLIQNNTNYIGASHGALIRLEWK